MRLVLILLAALGLGAACDDESSGPKELVECSDELDACMESVEVCIEETDFDGYINEGECPDQQLDFCLCMRDEGFNHSACDNCL